jgi:hypothetical protein
MVAGRRDERDQMAYKMRVPDVWVKASPNTAKIPYLINLDSAVGESAANRFDDVMLVQWILMTTLADPKPFPYLPPPPGGVHDFFDFVGQSQIQSANLATQMANEYRALAKTVFDNQAPAPTGKCDIVTVTWIRMFQMKYLGKFVSAIDGRVDPIDTAQGPFAKSTMIRLNAALPVWRCDIAQSDAPLTVKQAIRDFRN